MGNSKKRYSCDNHKAMMMDQAEFASYIKLFMA